ncbi:competence damage-inducible protein A [Amylibacter ulvae]|uniref:Competence damage-inducible protein A n=1 Tax=Paramylibacter ulvae TaxID=1651968 RepID=A0ABQ3CUC3_9RHOB|nr:CinA family protein [Amylibacter ulvae]GHA41398.1 competence damage-inducible protein A [Amylibacter ulvae]
MSDMAEQLLTAARNAGVTIATAESCTAGMISAALTDVAGSSDMFDRGFVTYTNDAKQQMLGVSSHTLQKFGAVSEQVAREMCLGALKHSDANLAVSVTGIAGPGGSEHKPEGRVCFGIVRTGKEPRLETVEFGAIGRANVRQKTVEHALALLFAQINDAKQR